VGRGAPGGPAVHDNSPSAELTAGSLASGSFDSVNQSGKPDKRGKSALWFGLGARLALAAALLAMSWAALSWAMV